MESGTSSRTHEKLQTSYTNAHQTMGSSANFPRQYERWQVKDHLRSISNCTF